MSSVYGGLHGKRTNLVLAQAEVVLKDLALTRITLVRNYLDRRRPFSEFSTPIGHRAQGHNDEVRSTLTFRLDEEGDQGNGLNRLAQTLCT